MTEPDNNRRHGPQMPEGLSVTEAIAWLNIHFPVRRAGAPADGEVPIYNPNWFEDLEPVQQVEQLTPAMFGVVDTKDVHYGWTPYSYSRPDNLKVQRRAAIELAAFTRNKTNWDALRNVYRSLESDGYARKGYQFSANTALWGLPAALRQFEATGDIKGAAHHTAKALFAPWGK